MRNCEACGAELPPPRRGGQRKKCEACSPPRKRPGAPAKPAAKKTTRKRAAKVVPLPTAEPPPASVWEATERELKQAGRRDTPLGMAALVLAGKLDRGEDSGSGLAALARQLQATIAEVVKDADSEQTPLDELRARRAKKKAAR